MRDMFFERFRLQLDILKISTGFRLKLEKSGLQVGYLKAQVEGPDLPIFGEICDAHLRFSSFSSQTDLLSKLMIQVVVDQLLALYVELPNSFPTW